MADGNTWFQCAALNCSEPRLAHAIVDIGPQLTHILEGLLTGYLAGKPGESERLF
jgi:hypothetical protein